MDTKIRKHLSTSQIIIIGFAGAILIGTLLLMLPISSASGMRASFSDAWFTATSAVCVTGLVVRDTATYWSVFGQCIILLLIQIGGLGIVTLSVSMTMLAGKEISLSQRSTLQDAIAAPQVGGIVKLTGFILKITFLIEFVGAALLSAVFCRDFGAWGIWLSIFHSVSAFCNAGFDLMGKVAPFSSLTAYAAQGLLNGVIMALILIGGIGFLVWEDIRINRYHIRKYSLQTKVVLVATAFLILAPAVYFYIAEFQGLPWKERMMAALFQSITPRTAGFNTADLRQFSGIGNTVTVILMLIGGSPGSTAGGMKTTTVAVLLLSAISVFSKKDDVECFNRRIADATLKNAAAILLMYLLLFLAGGMILSTVESLPLADCLYEAASAIGTVGLTMGITPTLSTVSRIVLIGLMFFGRVGGLTLFFAALPNKHQNISKKPQERITVG